MHICWVNRMFRLFLAVFSETWETGLNRLNPWVPLSSGYALGLVNREHSQEIAGRQKSEVGLLIALAPPHVCCPDLRPQFLHCGFSYNWLPVATPLPHSFWPTCSNGGAALSSKLHNLSAQYVSSWVPDRGLISLSIQIPTLLPQSHPHQNFYVYKLASHVNYSNIKRKCTGHIDTSILLCLAFILLVNLKTDIWFYTFLLN